MTEIAGSFVHRLRTKACPNILALPAFPDSRLLAVAIDLYAHPARGGVAKCGCCGVTKPGLLRFTPRAG